LSRFPLLMLLVFAGTLFTSATLLFLVQPMVGKMILPLQGGTPEVWNTCMVFFQAILLAGYAYAHALPRWLGVRKQAAVHLALLVVPFFFLPINIGASRGLITGGTTYPALQVLLLLLLTVGVPFFVISTSAPLLQKWFADTTHPAAHDPYFLYAASNLGSMIALLGYPSFVERLLPLAAQASWWVYGYGALVVLMVACAALLWLSPAPKPATPAFDPCTSGFPAGRPAARPAGKPDVPTGLDPEQPPSVAIKTAPADTAVRTVPAAAAAPAAALGGAVTWGRRLRWVLLAAVPSSLMLGVTTYATTDIAPIPLLWVVPLALYLASFILVFARISPQAQAQTVGVLILVLLGVVCYVMLSLTDKPQVLAFIWAGAVVAGFFSLRLWSQRDPDLLHRAMAMALPLLVLILVFLMSQSYLGLTVGQNLGLHLLTLFVAAMVCHGELARDRPAASHLTEFFLWMSLGGVLGGMFNALFAPLALSTLGEYPLALVAACLLMPPLVKNKKETAAGLYADLILAAVLMTVGAVLLGLRQTSRPLDFDHLARMRWGWQLTALVAALLCGLVYVWRSAGGRRRLDRALDLVLPLALGLFGVGLLLGLGARALDYPIALTGARFGLEPEPTRNLLALCLLVVLCFTFVERPARLGLGVGAVLLAVSFWGLFDSSILYQTRSFFGTMQVSVEEVGGARNLIFFGPTRVAWAYNRLDHGTTLHGKQFTDPELRDIPLTYFHRTGPAGQLLAKYNAPDRPVGVIGLGTGSLACYGLAGQDFTFFDIDPAVAAISYNDDKYFTFIRDAKERNVKMHLVIDDARLALERAPATGDDRFGVLIVDAFSSDAIPIHLITREAMKIYLDNLREDGVLAFHISNRYLDLKPVLARHAEEAKLVGYFQDDRDESEPGKTSSSWVVLARKPEYLSRLQRAENLDADEVWEELEQRYHDRGPAVTIDRFTWLREPVSKLLRYDQLLDYLRAGRLPKEGGTPLTSDQRLLLRELGAELGDVLQGTWYPLLPPPEGFRTWTDDYSDLLSVFSW
jgi:hypothetical protein